MTDYNKLVEALRYCVSGVCKNCSYFDKCKENGTAMDQLHNDAAAAIEALQAKVDRLTKENRELAADRPEMEEVNGHWEWRKPNGEVLLPKRGEIVRCKECIHFTQGGWCEREFDWFPVDENDFCSMAEKMEVQDA